VRGRAAAAVVASGSAWADWKPTKPVDIIVHTGPGGGSDLLARAVATMLAQEKLVPVGRWDECRAELRELFDRKNTATDGSCRIYAEYVALSAARTPDVAQGHRRARARARGVRGARRSALQDAQGLHRCRQGASGEPQVSGRPITSRDNIIRETLQHATGAKWAFVPFLGGGRGLRRCSAATSTSW
jgi:putative tricarboxylic transport membrane protein